MAATLMATVGSIRDGLAAALATVANLHAYAEWTGGITFPAAIVLPSDSGVDDLAFRGADLYLYDFEVLVAVSGGPPLEVQQQQLDDLYAPIRSALVADRTLGGACDVLLCDAWSRPDNEEINGNEYLARRLALRVYAR